MKCDEYNWRSAFRMVSVSLINLLRKWSAPLPRERCFLWLLGEEQVLSLPLMLANIQDFFAAHASFLGLYHSFSFSLPLFLLFLSHKSAGIYICVCVCVYGWSLLCNPANWLLTYQLITNSALIILDFSQSCLGRNLPSLTSFHWISCISIVLEISNSLGELK